MQTSTLILIEKHNWQIEVVYSCCGGCGTPTKGENLHQFTKGKKVNGNNKPLQIQLLLDKIIIK
jgi:hypothetical protein